MMPAKAPIKIYKGGDRWLCASTRWKTCKTILPEYAAAWTERLPLCCTGYRGGSRRKWGFLPDLLADFCIFVARALKGQQRFIVWTFALNETMKQNHSQNARQQGQKRRNNAETDGDATFVCVTRKTGGEWIGAKKHQVVGESVEAWLCLIQNKRRLTCRHIYFKCVYVP